MDAYENASEYRIRDRVLRRVSGLDPSGSLTPDELKTQLSSYYSAQRGSDRFWRSITGMRADAAGPMPRLGGKVMSGMGNVVGTGIHQGMASIFPFEPPIPEFMKSGKEMQSVIGSISPKLARAGKAAFAWAGPALVGYRTYTEGIGNLPRIITEEAASGVGFGIGSTLGAAVGAAAGPVGATVGYFAGGMAGALIGQAAGSTVADVGSAPFRAVPAAYKFFRNLGMQTRRLELGGSVSAGNRTMYAQTMRQRGLQQMNRSGMNARSLLGREAQFCHLR